MSITWVPNLRGTGAQDALRDERVYFSSMHGLLESEHERGRSNGDAIAIVQEHRCDVLTVHERSISGTEIGEPPNAGRFTEDLGVSTARIQVIEHDVAVSGATDQHARVSERERPIGGDVDEPCDRLSVARWLLVEHDRVRDRNGLGDRGGLVRMVRACS